MSIQIEKSGFVATVRVTGAADDLTQILRSIRLGDNIRAIVLCFELKRNDDLGQIDEAAFVELRDSPVPIVTAVNGAVGRSVTRIVEAAHLCIAGVSSGFVLGETGSEGREISADEAVKMGLINKAVSPEDVEDEAFALAEKISELAPAAIRSCLEAVGRGLESRLEDGLKLEAELFARLFATDDMREGTRAFLEKRAPRFTGK